MIKLTEILTEETPIYKDWDEFVNPHYIVVHLKNGKKIKIERRRVKGGNAAYHAILKAFNDNNYKITNKIVGAIVDNLGEDVVNEGNWSKIMKGVRKGSQSGPWTIVIIQNKKVIHQEPVKYRDAIPAHYESVKKQFRNANLGIEDNTGQIVYQEKI